MALPALMGCSIPLIEDDRWRPIPLGRDVDLGTFDTQEGAVAAIEAHDHPVDVD